jgi:hypothetical protein
LSKRTSHLWECFKFTQKSSSTNNVWWIRNGSPPCPLYNLSWVIDHNHFGSQRGVEQLDIYI